MSALNKRKKQPLRIWLILTVIVLAGGWLRFAHLGTASYWVDEVNHVAAAQAMLQGKGPVLLSNMTYDRSILFTRLVSWSFAVFGVNEFAARIPSAFWGTVTIPLVFFIAWRMFGRSFHGLLAALLFALHPLMIGWARECRMYTMFLFFFLVGVYGLYEGLEGTRRKYESGVVRTGLKKVLADWNIDLLWLVVGTFSLLLAASLHMLAGVVFPAALAYAVIMIVVTSMAGDRNPAVISKYLFFLFISLLGLLAGILLLPDFFAKVRTALEFQPNWSQYSYVQNPWYYVERVSNSFFWSVALFFGVGTVMVFYKRSQPAFYLWIMCVVPLFLLSTLFALRVERYAFHAYALMIMISAYGLAQTAYLMRAVLVKKILPATMARGSKKLIVYGSVLGMLAGVLVLSPWVRFARKIPAISYGTNGAVSHLEWRPAGEFVKQQMEGGEPVISTLPLTTYFYTTRADYFLASMARPRPEEVYTTNGEIRDYFSNAQVVDTLEDLQRVIALNPKGWLIVDLYRFERERYVRADVREFIKNKLKQVYRTPGGTVVVYAWG